MGGVRHGEEEEVTAQFKVKVAFEAAKGDKGVIEIASECGVHPQQVRKDFLCYRTPDEVYYGKECKGVVA